MTRLRTCRRPVWHGCIKSDDLRLWPPFPIRPRLSIRCQRDLKLSRLGLGSATRDGSEWSVLTTASSLASSSHPGSGPRIQGKGPITHHGFPSAATLFSRRHGPPLGNSPIVAVGYYYLTCIISIVPIHEPCRPVTRCESAAWPRAESLAR